MAVVVSETIRYNNGSEVYKYQDYTSRLYTHVIMTVQMKCGNAHEVVAPNQDLLLPGGPCIVPATSSHALDTIRQDDFRKEQPTTTFRTPHRPFSLSPTHILYSAAILLVVYSTRPTGNERQNDDSTVDGAPLELRAQLQDVALSD